MKKTVIVMLALFLALPAVSFAGSATSRWDLTIGGFVKFDMGYNTQAQGVDAFLAQRSGTPAFDQASDKYGSFFMYSGETRLNFLTKGPDAWGAKTSAFIEAHFRGNDSSNSAASQNQGAFTLRHAFMQLDWPTSKLVIGQTWQRWGYLPTFGNMLLDYNSVGPFLKGLRQPQIRFEQTIAKNWNLEFALVSPTNTLGSNSNTWNGTAANGGTGNVDAFTLSGMPFYEGSFGWTSDKCGSIGPWQMLFSVDGFYGQSKQVSSVTVANTFIQDTSKKVDAYGLAFRGFIPIIPEKKGNKQNALSVSGVLFYAQNPGWYQGPLTVNAYSTVGPGLTPAGSFVDPNWHAPVTYGGWGQVTYFFKDNLFASAWYGYIRNNLSNGFMNASGVSPGATAAAVQNTTQIIANIMYDVNAAIRLGFEYSYIGTRYATQTLTTGGPYGAGVPMTQKDGSMQYFRVGAYYFF